MSDSVIVTSNGFPDPETLPLVSDIQFREPYSSAAINRKLRGLALPGIYAGFNPTPGTGLNLLISSGTAGGTCSFDLGTYYQLSARQQADVTLAMTAGTAKLVALQVTYALGTETYQVNSASSIQAVEFVLLDTTATLADNQLEMCKVTIPAGATQITSDMIDLSGRIARSLSFELSSAIDSTSEEVAANSLAVKNAIAFVESEIAAAITTKALTVSGAASLISTLSVAGALTAKSTLAVTGITTLTGAANLKSTLSVVGNAVLSAALSVGSTLTVTGASVLSSSLTVGGATILKGGLTTTGSGVFVADVQTVILRPATADAAYYLRGQKSDGTAHWYLGQASATTGNITWGNNLSGKWFQLASDGTGNSNVTTMSFAGGVSVGSAGLSVTGAASVGSSLTVSGDTALAGNLTVAGSVITFGSNYTDTTSAALFISNSGNGGTGGITVANYQPAISLIDTSASAMAARIRNDSGWLRFDWDVTNLTSGSNLGGANFTSNRVIMGSQGQLSILNGGGNTARGLTIGVNTAGGGNLVGASQVDAMIYENHGSDAITRVIGWGNESTIGDGVTAQVLGDWVEFWANSQTVNANASVTVMSSYRSYDKTSTSIATAYAFDGRQMTRSGVARWNLYMQGSAPNFIRGQTIIGGTDTTLPTSSVNLLVNGRQQIVSDGITLQVLPATADASYYIRGTKSDSTLHWYLGQSTASTDTITLGNTISGKWLTLNADGTGGSNVSTMTYSGALAVTGAASVGSSLTVSGALAVNGAITCAGGGSFAASLTLGYRQMFQRSGAIPYQTFTRTDITAAPTSDTEIGRILFGYGMSGTDSWGTGGQIAYMNTTALAAGGGKIALSALNASSVVKAQIALDGNAGAVTVTGDVTFSGAVNFNGLIYANRHDSCIYFSSSDSTQAIIAQNYSAAGNFGYWDITNGAWVLRMDTSGNWNMYNGLNVTSDTAVGGTLAVSGVASFSSSVRSNQYIDLGYQNTTAGSRKLSFYSAGAVTVTGQIAVTGTTAAASTMALTAGTVTTSSDFTSGGKISTSSGEIVSTINGNNIRLDNGTYGVIHRNYSGNYYILLTDSGSSATGSYNSLRPITIGLSTGQVTIGSTSANSAFVLNGTATMSSTLAVSGAASMGSTLTVTGAAVFASTVTMGGTVLTSGEFQTTASNGLRMVNGNYGLITRFDGGNYYLLFTASGDQYGSWSSLRPLTINPSSGLVSMGHSLSVTGNITASNYLYTGSGASYMQNDANIYGSAWGGYLSTYLANNYKNASATDSYQGIGSYVLARNSYGAALSPGTNLSGSYLSPSTADGGYTGDTLTGTWRLMGYMTTTNDAHRTSLYQRVA